MDLSDPCEPSIKKERKVEAVGLLEETWFFRNLLNRKGAKMSRSYSDPNCSSAAGASSSPSSKFCQEIVKVPKEDEAFARHGSLIRAPSLPPCIGRGEEVREKESNLKLSKLTRRASHDLSDILPPRHTSKVSQGLSIPSRRLQRNTSVDCMNFHGNKEIRRRNINERKMRKSLSDLEFEEVQGFKDLGFKFDKEDLSPSVIKILPGLQEKNRVDSDQDDSVRRPYLSEVWFQECPTPPIPIDCVIKKSSEDIKTHIKFWAKAVASNLRQEC